jgi:hypothetical protein
MPNKLLQMNLKNILDLLYEYTYDDFYLVSDSEINSLSDRELISLYKKYRSLASKLEDEYFESANDIISYSTSYLRNIDNRQNSFYRTSRFN